MHPQWQMEAPRERSPYSDIALSETELLAQSGLEPHETSSLPWLRQWRQTDRSDRARLARHLEFLRLLVRSGDLEP
jgi:hypothetical protein